MQLRKAANAWARSSTALASSLRIACSVSATPRSSWFSAHSFGYCSDYFLCRSCFLRSLCSFCKCTPQTLLNFCPLFWQLVAGINLEGVAVGGHRLVKQLHSLDVLIPNSLFCERV